MPPPPRGAAATAPSAAGETPRYATAFDPGSSRPSAEPAENHSAPSPPSASPPRGRRWVPTTERTPPASSFTRPPFTPTHTPPAVLAICASGSPPAPAKVATGAGRANVCGAPVPVQRATVRPPAT